MWYWLTMEILTEAEPRSASVNISIISQYHIVYTDLKVHNCFILLFQIWFQINCIITRSVCFFSNSVFFSDFYIWNNSLLNKYYVKYDSLQNFNIFKKLMNPWRNAIGNCENVKIRLSSSNSWLQCWSATSSVRFRGITSLWRTKTNAFITKRSIGSPGFSKSIFNRDIRRAIQERWCR